MSQSNEISWLIAFVAGILSFLSPCVLPLVPGYLAFITGVSTDELKAKDKRSWWKILLSSVIFVLGFSAVFVALGASAFVLSDFIGRNKLLIEKIAGVLIIIFGLFIIGVLKIPFLYREKRFHLTNRPTGLAGIFLLGAAFAFGWTPCVGPILSSIILLASAQETIAKGILLLGIYSLGLGIPFIITGLIFNRILGLFSWVKRHYRLVNIVSGALLIATGVLLFTGRLAHLSSWLSQIIPKSWQYF